ncbi:MAG: hypothetical protein K8M05_39660 [Deltaproteobacteria bacterium]|nr:hypothetical protein [Kofleriaceae bacterium]
MKPTHIVLATLALLGAAVTTAHADEMFKPRPTLAPERKADQYTVQVETSVPNPCYAAGAVRPGPPPSVRIAADAVPLRVMLRKRGGMCAQVVSQVRHLHRHVKLGGKTGKTKVLVFAMLDGKVVGTASVDLPTKTPPPLAVTTSDWYAWVNKMPPGPASFHVTGLVKVPTPGYDVKLVPASPQGINPKELILDLVVTPRPGAWPQVVTPMSVRFDKPDDGTYTGVLIREPDGDGAHVQVDEVH